MAYGVRKFSHHIRVYGARGKNGSVKPVGTKKIMVNGVQRKAGEKATGRKGQLKKVITKKRKR